MDIDSVLLHLSPGNDIVACTRIYRLTDPLQTDIFAWFSKYILTFDARSSAGLPNRLHVHTRFGLGNFGPQRQIITISAITRRMPFHNSITPSYHNKIMFLPIEGFKACIIVQESMSTRLWLVISERSNHVLLNE